MSKPPAHLSSLTRILGDCALALLAMGTMYAVTGTEGLVALVVGYSLGVLGLLLLRELVVQFWRHFDDGA
jgi:hypothetical protein